MNNQSNKNQSTNSNQQNNQSNNQTYNSSDWLLRLETIEKEEAELFIGSRGRVFGNSRNTKIAHLPSNYIAIADLISQ